MKILLCHNFYRHPGGESQVFENQIKGLRRMGEKVVTYTRQNSEIMHMSKPEKVALVTSAYFSQQTRQNLLALIKNEKPDVAIVQNVFPLISPSIYSTLAGAQILIIQAVYNYRFICPTAELFTQGAICERCVDGNTIHAIIHQCYRQSYTQSAWYASIIGLHRIAGTFSKKIDSFMVPDDFLGSKLTRGGIPAEKIWRNPNPFFVDDYRQNASHKGYVLFVGRFVRHKGILTLIRAMERTNSSCQLLVVGQGELTKQIQDDIAEKGLAERVKLLGPLWGDDLMRLIEECAAVVIPSEWYDNLPLMLCQANAVGKPVIASRINGIPEYVREAHNGFLFEVGDAVELAKLIEKVLSFSHNEYRHISNASRTFAEDVLDYPNHYHRLLEMIEKLTGKGPSQIST